MTGTSGRSMRPRARSLTKKGIYRVRALMDPEIDMRKLVKVLVVLAEYKLKQDVASLKKIRQT